MLALRRAGESELEKLRQIFLKAETDIINEIGRLRSMGNVDYHAVAALLQSGGQPGDIGEDAARAAARLGCAAAGLSTQRPGGIASVPTEEELLAAISGY